MKQRLLRMTRAQEAIKRRTQSKLLTGTALFQGQRHPARQKKHIRLEQWIEVCVDGSGRVTTTLYPSNEKLIERGQAMWPPPEYVYRRINFPNGIPPEYDWTGVIDENHRKFGGCGIQRMTVDTWLQVIKKEARRPGGHVGPSGVPAVPRANGACNCRACSPAGH